METSRDAFSLVGANKIGVFALSLAGFLLDGPDLADLFFVGAMIVWLWMSGCIQFERWLINVIRPRNMSTLKAGEARNSLSA